MKSEGNLAPTAFAPQVHSQHGIPPMSEVFPTCPSSFMPARNQSLGISVSLVEDDPHTRQVLSDWIRPAYGFNLLNYHKTAESALASLPSENPSIVLIGLNLPGTDASKCVRQLKPILQQTQFVTLNEDEDADGIFGALAAGATGYLSRKAARVELLGTLKLIHAGGSPMSGAIAKKVLHSFQNHSVSGTQVELSPRENRILRLLARGSSYNETASSRRMRFSRGE